MSSEFIEVVSVPGCEHTEANVAGRTRIYTSQAKTATMTMSELRDLMAGCFNDGMAMEKKDAERGKAPDSLMGAFASAPKSATISQHVLDQAVAQAKEQLNVVWLERMDRQAIRFHDRLDAYLAAQEVRLRKEAKKGLDERCHQAFQEGQKSVSKNCKDSILQAQAHGFEEGLEQGRREGKVLGARQGVRIVEEGKLAELKNLVRLTRNKLNIVMSTSLLPSVVSDNLNEIIDQLKEV